MATHTQQLQDDQLMLNNIIQYYNDYYEMISKIVSILDSYVPKEIAGPGGCNLSVAHDVDNHVVSIMYGEIIEEDQEHAVETCESQYSPGGCIFEDEQCDEVSQAIADGVIEEIFESEPIIIPSDGKEELIEDVGGQHSYGIEPGHTTDDQSAVGDDDNIGIVFDKTTALSGTGKCVERNCSQGEETPDIKYVCQYMDCTRKFTRAKEYSIHQEKAHPWLVETAIALRCKYINCQVTFNNVALLHAHYATHRIRKKSPAHESDSVSTDLSGPQNKPIADRPGRVRKCEFCEAVLDRKVNVYSQHCLEVHNRSPYACPLCTEPFHLQSHLSEHVKTDHPQEEVEVFLTNDLWREFTVKEGVRMAECRFCYRVIYSLLSRNNHAEQHRKEVNRVCMRCGGKHSETFCSYPKSKYESKLEKLHCAECDRWMSKKNFKEHLVTHTKERNFPCTVCKKTFKVRRTATRHIQNHVNASNRKRKCYDCAAVFTDEAEIPVHYRLEHPTLHPYRCPICSEGFHEKALLTDHCHMHSDEDRRMVSIKAPLASYQVGNARVFECTLCRRAFSTKRATIAHLIVHTDRPFVCSQCNLSFRVEAMLAMHMVDVHQVKDFSISL